MQHADAAHDVVVVAGEDAITVAAWAGEDAVTAKDVEAVSHDVLNLIILLHQVAHILHSVHDVVHVEPVL